MSKQIITIGGVAQVKGRPKGVGPVVLSIKNEINDKLISNGWLSLADFDSVSIVLRYSESASDETVFQSINNRKELPVAINLAMSELISAKGNQEVLRSIVEPAIYKCIGEISTKYGLQGCIV